MMLWSPIVVTALVLDGSRLMVTNSRMMLLSPISSLDFVLPLLGGPGSRPDARVTCQSASGPDERGGPGSSAVRTDFSFSARLVTFDSTTAYAPISTPSPIRASGAMRAVGVNPAQESRVLLSSSRMRFSIRGRSCMTFCNLSHCMWSMAGKPRPLSPEAGRRLRSRLGRRPCIRLDGNVAGNPRLCGQK
jgi:hypothetical protein